MSARIHLIPFLGLGLFLCLGCGSRPYRVHTPAPPSAELRAKFGTIAVTSATPAPKVMVDAPKARVGPGIAGAGIGAAGGLAVGGISAAAAGPMAPFAFIAVAPFTTIGGAVIGGASGATLGHASKDDRDKAADIKAAVQPDTLNRIALDEMTQWASTHQRYSITNQPGNAPPQTRLEMHITHVGLRVTDKRQSVAFVALHTRLVEARSGRVVYESFMEYLSPALPYEEWQSDNATLLIGEFQKGAAEVARRSLTEIFEKSNDAQLARK